jgi:hypothetical protein
VNGIARGVVGHLTGLTCALSVAALGPRIMDGVVCLAGMLHVVHVADDFCSPGAANLGEGGLWFSWASVATLLVLVVIMEALFRLGRWYRSPAWCGVLAILAGCPLLLGLIVVVTGADAVAAIGVGLALGIPVGLASTAYWLALRAWRPMAKTA